MNDVPDATATMKFGVGQPIRRLEDLRLLTGKGRYQDDQTLHRQTWCVFVRSPHAHARIRSIDTAAASRAPGVVAVLHRDRLRERRHRHAEGGDAAQEARRLADVRAATSGAGRRSRALCRRSGGDGDRRDAGAGEGRRGTRRGGLRSAAIGDLGRRGGGAGCAARVGREPGQHLAHHRTRQPRGDRGGVRAGGAHRASGATSSRASMRNTWSRAARSAPTIRRRIATRCTPT